MMKRIAIIGAGISGLFIANLLKKNPNYKINIFEKNNSVDLDEGYGVQLSVNCIKLLNEIGFNKLDNKQIYHPDKINFYSSEKLDKICELDIANFNNKDSKYTTLKRSVLTSFLKKDLHQFIQTSHSVSNINQCNKLIKVSFENNKTFECDCLIISDGVFSKSKSLILNNQNNLKYSNLLAIRGLVKKNNDNLYNKNISLFLGPNFHYVTYPINSSGDINHIAITKYKLSIEEQKNYSLFRQDFFIEKVLNKIPPSYNKIFKNLEKMKIFPIFVSKKFYQSPYKNIHLIGDAFFAYPPSFAQGATQSIESAHELFKCIENNSEDKFFLNRVKKTKMINNRSKFNQFAFHLSNPLTVFFRNIFLKNLVKNSKFLESYLGKIYRN